MSSTGDPVVETLQPEDFAIFNGYEFRGTQQHAVWLDGPSMIASFGMNPDSVTVSVYRSGVLDVTPVNEEHGIGGVGVAPGFWARTSELQATSA